MIHAILLLGGPTSSASGEIIPNGGDTWVPSKGNEVWIFPAIPVGEIPWQVQRQTFDPEVGSADRTFHRRSCIDVATYSDRRLNDLPVNGCMQVDYPTPQGGSEMDIRSAAAFPVRKEGWKKIQYVTLLPWRPPSLQSLAIFFAERYISSIDSR